ncbi:DUF4168 domain-containing protein [Candidatus Babeliales bacterium]|nr:DUF4168 domain-containing protein [Candidatus Babeliales bacterium]MCF7910144.1 DUF4168 domain-containing protein [Candidatus Pacearchaeota archaeon]
MKKSLILFFVLNLLILNFVFLEISGALSDAGEQIQDNVDNLKEIKDKTADIESSSEYLNKKWSEMVSSSWVGSLNPFFNFILGATTENFGLLITTFLMLLAVIYLISNLSYIPQSFILAYSEKIRLLVFGIFSLTIILFKIPLIFSEFFLSLLEGIDSLSTKAIILILIIAGISILSYFLKNFKTSAIESRKEKRLKKAEEGVDKDNERLENVQKKVNEMKKTAEEKGLDWEEFNQMVKGYLKEMEKIDISKVKYTNKEDYTKKY